MEILNDFSTSVKKALGEIDPKWPDYNGLIVCGTHSPHDAEFIIDKIREARESKTPFLGICFGHQLAAIEYARNVLGIKDATSEELGEGTPIVNKMEKLRVGMYPVFWKDGFENGITVSGNGEITETSKTMESHWHNYRINPEMIVRFQEKFLMGYSDDNDTVEYMILMNHPHHVGVQFHPEYQSSKDKPHHVLVEFLKSCK